MLHKLLHTEFRGAFIPPLPEKRGLISGAPGASGGSELEFLHLRRTDLQVGC